MTYSQTWPTVRERVFFWIARGAQSALIAVTEREAMVPSEQRTGSHFLTPTKGRKKETGPQVSLERR